MNHCHTCRKTLSEDHIYCPFCGIRLSQNEIPNNKKEQLFYSLLALFFPSVGFILFVIWFYDKPKLSKLIGIVSFVSLLIRLIILYPTFF